MVRKIKRIIAWLLVLWEDEDWDHAYLFRILRFKLSSMEKFFRTRGMLANREVNALQMKRCMIIIDRLIADDYYENIMRGPFKHKWYERECRDKNNDLKYLFDQIRKHVLTWWD